MAVAELVLIPVLVGCGDSASPAVSDLPPPLTEAASRLERAEFETVPILAGVDAIPALLVRSEPPVVLASVATGRGFQDVNLTPARDPEGGTVDLTISIGCANALAAGARRDNGTISQVLHASELCSKRDR